MLSQLAETQGMLESPPLSLQIGSVGAIIQQTGGLLKSRTPLKPQSLWPREVVSFDKVTQELAKERQSHFPHCKDKVQPEYPGRWKRKQSQIINKRLKNLSHLRGAC